MNIIRKRNLFRRFLLKKNMTKICYSCLKNNKCLYTTYMIENIDIDEIDDIFYKYINIHNQKFIFFYFDCQFEIKFKDNVFAKIEINQHFNTDYINIKNDLLFYIDSCSHGNFIFDNIIKMEITVIGCRCNMTYKYHICSPMSMLERYINMNIKNNHPIIRQCDYLLLNK